MKKHMKAEAPTKAQPYIPHTHNQHDEVKRKMRLQPRDIISRAFVVVGVILLLVAAGMFLFQQWNYHKQDEINKALATHVQIKDEADIPKDECPITVDWEGLKAVNEDVVAWIYIPDTEVNYPIYQGKDNDEYLRHNAEGDWSIGGQLFLDYQNQAPGLADAQSIVYGHHLNNGTMFKAVADFDQQEVFDTHQEIWYITEAKAYKLRPLFFYDTDRDDASARTFDFNTPEELHAYLNERLARAVTKRADAETLIPQVSHAMTLLTCVYYNKYPKDHGRGLLVCVPSEEIEQTPNAG